MTEKERCKKLLESTDHLKRGLDQLDFKPPVETVYNPLAYAGDQYAEYLTRYGAAKKKVLFVGMNPGPWGMAQTGVPFGEVAAVRDWLGIDGTVDKPEDEIPKRPVTGLDCPRSEVSGRRVWGLMRERYGTPERFFEDHLILNYCPLLFFSFEAKNITPDKLKKEDRTRLFRLCDDYLLSCIRLYSPRYLIGLGNFAAGRIRETLDGTRTSPGGREVEVITLLHPSPANPWANRGWAEQAEKKLTDSGVWDRG